MKDKFRIYLQLLSVLPKCFKTIIKNQIGSRNNTCCRYLWDRVLIDQNGSVYICCHYKPVIIGNIYKHDLFSIWTKSISLKILRWMSLNKGLYCNPACNSHTDKDKENIDHYPKFMKYPKIIRIQYGEFCNLNCLMCYQDHNSKSLIDNDILKKNIDWRQAEEIEFQGGEILAMKNAKELYLWVTRQMNKKVNLVTNGMLITDEWAEYLVKGSRWIRISVNAVTKKTHEIVNIGSNYEKVIDNIKKLIHLKRQYNLDTRIIFRFTIVPENIHEAADAIEFAESLGCDEIKYGFDHSVPNFLKEHKILKEQLKNKISQLINGNLNIKIVKIRLGKLGLLEKGAYKNDPSSN